jgi:soluble lytic murein transglycosylase-like protein
VGRAVEFARERRWVTALLALALAFLVYEGWQKGPAIARQAWSIVGVQRVESHAPLLCAASAESGIDACLLAGVMYVESRGRPDAVSPAGARGLFQLMPAAAEDAAKRLGIPAPDRDKLLADPALNARLGANHLAWLYRLEGPDLVRVLVAYNAGRGRLAEWARDAGSFRAWREKQQKDGDSHTLVYAEQVLEFAERFRARGVVAQCSASPAPTAATQAEAAQGQ